MPNNAMDAMRTNFETLRNAKTTPEVQVGIAKQLFVDTAPSGIMYVVNTPGNPASPEYAQEQQQVLASYSQWALEYVQGEGGFGPAKALVSNYWSLVEFVREVADEVTRLVAGFEVNPQNGTTTGDISHLNDGLDNDPLVHASIAVRGPFQFIPPVGECGEKSFQLPVECGGCGVVIKEFRGLQLRLVLRLMTTVIEPWFPRRRIINTWVWVLEWVPVEVIKTITVKCGCDDGATKVTKTTVLDRELINFWRCL
jgi:hypothetical protein